MPGKNGWVVTSPRGQNTWRHNHAANAIVLRGTDHARVEFMINALPGLSSRRFPDTGKSGKCASDSNFVDEMYERDAPISKHQAFRIRR